MQYIISQITNRIGWIDYLQIFGLLAVFVWKVWIGVGTILRKITIILLLNKWYEILLPSGCQKLWMYKPGLRGGVVFHIKAGLFPSTGDGWRGRGYGLYLLTYELVQTKVDIDMPQRPVSHSNVTAAFCHHVAVLTVRNLTFFHRGIHQQLHIINCPTDAIFVCLTINQRSSLKP